jgi:hypothetical protein
VAHIKKEARGKALERTLQEPLPEMRRLYGGLRPAIGFDTESV